MKSRSAVFFINFDILHLFLLLTLNGGKCFTGFKLLLNDCITNKMLSLKNEMTFPFYQQKYALQHKYGILL